MVSMLVESDSTRHISNFRASQGHSGGIAIDPELQDNVRLPKGFTEYIHHVGKSVKCIQQFEAGCSREDKVSHEEDNPCSAQQ